MLFAGQKQGTHTARFGEIEQRGVALTPKGRQLYDDLLRNAGTGQDNLTHQMHLQETFASNTLYSANSKNVCLSLATG